MHHNDRATVSRPVSGGNRVDINERQVHVFCEVGGVRKSAVDGDANVYRSSGSYAGRITKYFTHGLASCNTV